MDSPTPPDLVRNFNKEKLLKSGFISEDGRLVKYSTYLDPQTKEKIKYIAEEYIVSENRPIKYKNYRVASYGSGKDRQKEVVLRRSSDFEYSNNKITKWIRKNYTDGEESRKIVYNYKDMTKQISKSTPKTLQKQYQEKKEREKVQQNQPKKGMTKLERLIQIRDSLKKGTLGYELAERRVAKEAGYKYADRIKAVTLNISGTKVKITKNKGETPSEFVKRIKQIKRTVESSTKKYYERDDNSIKFRKEDVLSLGRGPLSTRGVKEYLRERNKDIKFIKNMYEQRPSLATTYGITKGIISLEKIEKKDIITGKKPQLDISQKLYEKAESFRIKSIKEKSPIKKVSFRAIESGLNVGGDVMSFTDQLEKEKKNFLKSVAIGSAFTIGEKLIKEVGGKVTSKVLGGVTLLAGASYTIHKAKELSDAPSLHPQMRISEIMAREMAKTTAEVIGFGVGGKITEKTLNVLSKPKITVTGETFISGKNNLKGFVAGKGKIQIKSLFRKPKIKEFDFKQKYDVVKIGEIERIKGTRHILLDSKEHIFEVRGIAKNEKSLLLSKAKSGKIQAEITRKTGQIGKKDIFHTDLLKEINGKISSEFESISSSQRIGKINEFDISSGSGIGRKYKDYEKISIVKQKEGIKQPESKEDSNILKLKEQKSDLFQQTTGINKQVEKIIIEEIPKTGIETKLILKSKSNKINKFLQDNIKSKINQQEKTKILQKIGGKILTKQHTKTYTMTKQLTHNIPFQPILLKSNQLQKVKSSTKSIQSNIFRSKTISDNIFNINTKVSQIPGITTKYSFYPNIPNKHTSIYPNLSILGKIQDFPTPTPTISPFFGESPSKHKKTKKKRKSLKKGYMFDIESAVEKEFKKGKIPKISTGLEKRYILI